MEIVTRTAFAAVVAGKTRTDRKVSIVDQVSDTSTLVTIAGFGGKAGKAALAAAAMPAAVDVAHQCANSNYAPVANVIAAVRGCNFIVNRATFHALPAIIEGWILDMGLTKSAGYRIDKKTGMQVPNSERVSLMTLKAWAVDVIRASEEIRAQREAEKAAEQTQAIAE